MRNLTRNYADLSKRFMRKRMGFWVMDRWRLNEIGRIIFRWRQRRKSTTEVTVENILNGVFYAGHFGEKCLTDVTEMKYGIKGKAYLSAILICQIKVFFLLDRKQAAIHLLQCNNQGTGDTYQKCLCQYSHGTYCILYKLISHLICPFCFVF